jgi:hypothetical protein
MKHTPLHYAIHEVLINKEGDGVVWASYTSLTICKCTTISLSHKDLETLVVDDADKSPAQLFREDHPLADPSILKEILVELTSRPASPHLALTYFFDKNTTTHYHTFLPLLDFKE